MAGLSVSGTRSALLNVCLALSLYRSQSTRSWITTVHRDLCAGVPRVFVCMHHWDTAKKVNKVNRPLKLLLTRAKLKTLGHKIGKSATVKRVVLTSAARERETRRRRKRQAELLRCVPAQTSSVFELCLFTLSLRPARCSARPCECAFSEITFCTVFSPCQLT